MRYEDRDILSPVATLKPPHRACAMTTRPTLLHSCFRQRAKLASINIQHVHDPLHQMQNRLYVHEIGASNQV